MLTGWPAATGYLNGRSTMVAESVAVLAAAGGVLGLDVDGVGFSLGRGLRPTIDPELPSFTYTQLRPAALASETGAASGQVLSAAQSLSGDSNRLKLEVIRFLDSVRAA